MSSSYISPRRMKLDSHQGPALPPFKAMSIMLRQKKTTALGPLTNIHMANYANFSSLQTEVFTLRTKLAAVQQAFAAASCTSSRTSSSNASFVPKYLQASPVYATPPQAPAQQGCVLVMSEQSNDTSFWYM